MLRGTMKVSFDCGENRLVDLGEQRHGPNFGRRVPGERQFVSRPKERPGAVVCEVSKDCQSGVAAGEIRRSHALPLALKIPLAAPFQPGGCFARRI
jgi:hypothetical protein